VLESGPAQIDLSGTFEHPPDSFTTGHLAAHVRTTALDLAQIRTLQKEQPNTSGEVLVNADLSATLSHVKTGGQQSMQFLLTSVNADAAVSKLRLQGQDYGNLSLTARTSSHTVHYDLASNFAGSNIRLAGDTQLLDHYPTSVDASLRNLPLQRVLAAAHQSDFPVKGNLSGTAHISGTVENPDGKADLDLANAVLYGEPVDHLRARVAYLPQSIDVPQLELLAGSSRIDLNARYDHPAGDLAMGRLQFQANSNRIDLARIKNIQERRPGLGGTVQLAASGTADVRPGQVPLMLRALHASLQATGLAAQGEALGNLNFTASTTGAKMNFALDSNLAGASIHSQGVAQLADGYPLNAQLTFNNVAWAKFQTLIGSAPAGPLPLDALADGQVSLSGPVMKARELNGSLQLTRLEITAFSSAAPQRNPVVLQNQGPITATLNRGVVRIGSAHLTGPQTDLQALGTVPLGGEAMNVSMNGKANLAILQNFSRNITSSGRLVLGATMRGTIARPIVNGRIELDNGSFHYAASDFVAAPNGISNANGVILFDGNSAVVNNLTGDTGGGKVTLTGFVARSGNVRFGLRANASNVLVLANQTVSVVIDSSMNLTGSTQASILSGTVTINRVTYAPQTDIGSFLTRAAPPVQTTAPSARVLDKMKLDIHVRGSDALAVQASLAENLQMNVDLQVTGTAAHPGVLGRVNIDEGKLVFFGSTYTVNNGTIEFYDPFRIQPILNFSLETMAQNVDVVLHVTGPIDDMKLSYTSDPPLQFQEIVSLLAVGTTPMSDPTLLANQPSVPPQSFQSMGESALVTAAVADPLANRLQRVFGVTQLKIDPTFTSGSQLPQAQLTLRQRVAENITFTYVTALNAANAQTVEVDVTLSPRWSATATRDYNGIFSINLLYKKQFR
jgi:translocation and assembly module TamB